MISISESLAPTHRPALAYIKPTDLQSGLIGDLFREGASAVILQHDDRIKDIWHAYAQLTHEPVYSKKTTSSCWDEQLINVARNHHSGDLTAGDMLRFIPGHMGHIARKMKIYPEINHFPNTHNRRLCVEPKAFWHGTYEHSLADEILTTSWQLMSEVLNSVIPTANLSQPYAVALERIKYPIHGDLDKMFSLLSDAAGGWTSLGQKIDTHKTLAAGPFAYHRVKDLFALGMLVPGIKNILSLSNEWFKRNHSEQATETQRIVHAPHIDSTKYVTALASDRDVLTTQVWHDGEWIDLPLSIDSIAIFPSRKLSKLLSIKPTYHRVLMKQPVTKKATTDNVATRSNVTLSLGIIDYPQSATSV